MLLLLMLKTCKFAGAFIRSVLMSWINLICLYAHFEGPWENTSIVSQVVDFQIKYHRYLGDFRQLALLTLNTFANYCFDGPFDNSSYVRVKFG